MLAQTVFLLISYLLLLNQKKGHSRLRVAIVCR